MRIIRGIFFSLLALVLVAATGIFIFFQVFDTDQYLGQITRKASSALGRPVSIGSMGLGLSWRGITVDAGPVTVADDTAFTSQPFVTIDRVRIIPDLGALFLQRQVHIRGVILQSPQVHFIRDQQGQINAQGIGFQHQADGDNTAVPKPNGGIVTGPSVDVAPVEIKPRSIPARVSIGYIKVQDAAVSFIDQGQGMPLDIWLTGINASLKGISSSSPARLSFSASLYSNIPNVHGSVLIGHSDKGIELSDLVLKADLSRLDIERLKDITPEESEVPVFKNIAGVVQLNIAHLQANPLQGFETNGDISISGGVIRNFNVIKTLLSHTLEMFVGMGNMDNLFNGQLKDKLNEPDTLLEKARAQFSVHDNTVFVDDSLIQTDIFELTAKGSVDRGLNVDMQTMLYLDAGISAALVSRFDGFKYLMDDSKRIAVDASLKGTIPRLKYKPNKDFRKKSRKALMQEGANILGALLGGAKAGPQAADASSGDTAKKAKDQIKNMFKNLLQ